MVVVVSADVTDYEAVLREVRQLGQLIADAFVHLPQNHWLVPDAEERERVFRAYFALQVELGVRHGLVQTTPERDAVAVWLPVNRIVPALPEYNNQLAKTVEPVWLDRFHAFEDTLVRHHPVHEPHEYLVLLAVRPDRQRKGVGGKLLRQHHRILDQRGMAGYLHAANGRSINFYLRQGWHMHGAPFPVSPGGPLMYPMTRDPQPR